MNRRTRIARKQTWLLAVVLVVWPAIARQAAAASNPLAALGTREPGQDNAAQNDTGHPFLRTLAQTPGGVVIAYGSGQASRQSANVIRNAIRQIPGQAKWNRMIPASQFDKAEMDKTGSAHVIAVGTLGDNVVMRSRNWLPNWWMDRDWYYNDYKHAVPKPGRLPYQKTSGFIVGGFGEWDKDTDGVGVIEVDRSFYFMEWVVRTRLNKVLPQGHKYHPIKKKDWPTYPKDFPLRLMVRISGSGDEGVNAAAHALADHHMLNGVVLAQGAKAQDGPTMFTLPAKRYAAKLPFTPPTKVAGYTYQGWLLPSAFQYDGFRQDAGVDAKRMFRIKYKPPFGITNFWTSPNRRASQFELTAVDLGSSAAASKARATLSKHLASTKSYKQGRIKGFHMKVAGDKLFLESIPEGKNDAGSEILKQFVKDVGTDW